MRGMASPPPLAKTFPLKWKDWRLVRNLAGPNTGGGVYTCCGWLTVALQRTTVDGKAFPCAVLKDVSSGNIGAR